MTIDLIAYHAQEFSYDDWLTALPPVLTAWPELLKDVAFVERVLRVCAQPKPEIEQFERLWLVLRLFTICPALRDSGVDTQPRSCE